MALSSKIKYSTRMLIYLGLHYPDKMISVRRISEFTGVSSKYLEQIIPDLKEQDIIRSVQGKYGGYLLNRDPKSITLFDIHTIFNKRIFLDIPNDEKGYKLDRFTWGGYEDDFIKNLKGRTLAALISDYRDKHKDLDV